jgi:hypothetical protein
MKMTRGLMKEKEEIEEWEFYPAFVTPSRRSLTRSIL